LSFRAIKFLNQFKLIMDKPTTINKLLNKKTKDYSYTMAFFIIFSFFVFAVIRPNLITVFEITSKIDQLKKVDMLYAEQINKIIEVQSAYEQNRDNFGFLTEAISVQPEVNKVLFDVNVSSEGSKLKTERLIVTDINLKDKGALNKMKSFSINMNLLGTFEEVMALIKKVYAQRRLKLIPEFEMSRGTGESSESANLKIRMKIEGFYL